MDKSTSPPPTFKSSSLRGPGAGQAETLARIEARLQALESRLEQTTQLLEQALPMISMATDALDEVVTQSTQRTGVMPQERFEAVVGLAEKLSEPKVGETLTALLDKIELIGDVVDQLPGLVAMGVDSVDDITQSLAEHGSVETRLRLAADLLEQTSRPENLEHLSALLQRLEQLAEVAKLSDELPGLVAMGVDGVDELLAGLKRTPRELLESLQVWLELGGQVDAFLGQEKTRKMLESLLTDPAVLDVMSRAVNAAIDSSRSPITPMGPFGMFRQLRQPNAKSALGFLMRFLQSFGEGLDSGAQQRQKKLS